MIFKGSRYSNTPMYNRDEATIFERRELYNFNLENSIKHTVMQKDNLSSLAYQHYGDAQLWWVILEANPSYSSIFDINVGDIIIIPSKEEVMNIV